jgi:hypothetical protein
VNHVGLREELQILLVPRSRRRMASGANCREQQRNESADDDNHDKQFDGRWQIASESRRPWRCLRRHVRRFVRIEVHAQFCRSQMKSRCIQRIMRRSCLPGRTSARQRGVVPQIDVELQHQVRPGRPYLLG